MMILGSKCRAKWTILLLKGKKAIIVLIVSYLNHSLNTLSALIV